MYAVGIFGKLALVCGVEGIRAVILRHFARRSELATVLGDLLPLSLISCANMKYFK